jgi:predicted transcriptional regulator
MNGINGKRRKNMKLADIKETLHAEVIVGHEDLNEHVTAGTGSDLMSDILRGPTSGVLLLTGLNNIQVIRTAVIAGVKAVVLVRGKMPSSEMINHARDHKLPLLSTPFTMYSSCGRLFGKGLRGVEQKVSR